MTNFALTASAAPTSLPLLLKLCLHKVPHTHTHIERQVFSERGRQRRLNVFKNNFNLGRVCVCVCKAR